MINIITIVFANMSVLLWSIILHEYGHILYYKKKVGKYPVMMIEKGSLTIGNVKEMEQHFDNTDYNALLLWGVCLGLLTYLPAFLLYGFTLVLSLPIYLLMCTSDLRNIKWKSLKN